MYKTKNDLPEDARSKAVEIGIKGSALDGILSGALAIYDERYDNYQANFTDQTGTPPAQIRAAFLGLGHETDAKSMTHAVLDAVAFAFRESLDAVRDGGATVNRLTAVGGGTHSEIWLKIIATVLNVPIDLPAAGDVGGAFGGARMGLMAATGAAFNTVCTKPKIAKTILPEKQAQAAYAAAYRRYIQIYPAIKDIK